MHSSTCATFLQARSGCCSNGCRPGPPPPLAAATWPLWYVHDDDPDGLPRAQGMTLSLRARLQRGYFDRSTGTIALEALSQMKFENGIPLAPYNRGTPRTHWPPLPV